MKLGGIDNYKVTGHQNKIYALRYAKDNPKLLISGGWDDTVLFWDLNSKNNYNKSKVEQPQELLLDLIFMQKD